MNIEPKIAAFAAELTAIRRDIHAHPELGFEEERTSAIVATKLKEWGCEVTTGVGKTGVVGMLRVGNNPRAIGLRADMDALPMDEPNTFDHRSQTRAACTPAAMTAIPRCCSAPPSISRRRATSTARCISSSSRPRRAAAAPRR